MSKILIIDDDVDIVEAIKIVLESKGHKTITAYEGEEGYKKAAERPDLIILDVVMKTKDQGFQISYKLKNHPELSRYRYSCSPLLEGKPALDLTRKPMRTTCQWTTLLKSLLNQMSCFQRSINSLNTSETGNRFE